MFNSSMRVLRTSIATACGHIVDNMVTSTRKKCVRLSTDCYDSLHDALITWTTTHLTTWFNTTLSALLSTAQIAQYATVTDKVMPRFHSTYYYNNRFYRKDF